MCEEQKRALKTIYGFDRKYEDLLKLTGLTTLEERRECAFANFTTKLHASDRFNYLFPENTAGNMELRSTKQFVEDYARSNRLYNSPVYSMRRFLNSKGN